MSPARWRLSKKAEGVKPKSQSKPTTISAIQNLQEKAGNQAVSMLILRAGTPKGVPAPGGIQQIVDKSQSKAAGTRGLTVIPNAVAFQQPAFNVTTSAAKTGTHSRSYSAKVEPTSAPDIAHDSWYPLEGFHRIRVDPGDTPAYGYLSEEKSGVIRAGEDEHLNDAAQAHKMTYGLVADEVNALAKRTAETPFTSTESKAQAEGMASQALASRLPQAFGKTTEEKVSPASWVSLFDKLLLQTQDRDTKGWHYMKDEYTEKKHKGLEVYDIVEYPGLFMVPGKDVVHY